MRTIELCKVHVISRKALTEASLKHSNSEAGLDAWFQIAKRAQWESLTDVRKTYPQADGVAVRQKTYTVFNICGNKFRLIVKIEYKYQKIFIKHLLTHAEYDREEWKK